MLVFDVYNEAVFLIAVFIAPLFMGHFYSLHNVFDPV